eukprot:428127-Ditylum_brightwellii.AAC.1
MREYVDFVWATTGKDATLLYFKKYGTTEPTDTLALEANRNAKMLKNLILRKLLWNSFSPNFQIEVLTKEEKFKKGNDHDGVLLWQHLIDHVNPLTCISMENLTDDLKAATLKSFKQDIKVFNAWFTNKQTVIVKEVGTEGYIKYLQCLFKTYKTANNKEFLVTIAKERHK